MGNGEGSWIVVVQLPNLQSKVITRYRVRSDAEQQARKLERMMGNGYRVQAMFELEPQSECFQVLSAESPEDMPGV